jgi:scyllo-inositol 2-dehydrogenase (NADP+)
VKFGLDPQEPQLKGGSNPSDPHFGVDTSEGPLTTPDGSKEVISNVRGNYRAYYDGVAAAILDGAPVPVTAEDARDGLALIHLARRASNEGRRLRVPDANSTAA